MSANSSRHIHFIGICGTAMGSVAAGLRDQGFTVSGSDAGVYPPMSTFLEDAGIKVIEGFSADNIPEGVDLVVIGNAMSRGNEEVEAVLDRRLHYISLPEILKSEFLRGRRNLVVTGTHGKTTTSSMLASTLVSAGRDPNYLIGGIPADLGRGCFLGGGDFVVLEGDEYDTAFFDKRSKFVHYLPEVVIVNNLEFDHADIFDDLDAIKLSFRRMLNIVPRNGCVFANGDEPNVLDVVSNCPAPVVTVGLSESCDHTLTDLVFTPETSSFTLDGEVYTIPMVGEFNVRNAAMAASAARFAGLTPDEIRTGLASFGGIARRQQERGMERGVRVIDDFAHHPTALLGAIAALRQRYPDSRIWALFEPRSNTSRRNVHQAALIDALATADGVYLTAIDRPEQLDASEALDTAHVVAELKNRKVDARFATDAEAIVKGIIPDLQEGDIVGVFSNGGFGGIHQNLLNALKDS